MVQLERCGGREMQEFDGKVAFAMGGTTGIGRAAADLLLARGAAVSIFGAAISADGVQAHLADLSERMLVFTGDGSVAVEVKAALDSTATEFGGIDILICAAAIHPYGTVETTDEATWDRVMSVNV